MIVSYQNVIDYIRMWLSGIRGTQNKDGFVIPMTGGVDSCVCAALCLDIRPSAPIYFVDMGFKPENEKLFEEWATKKFTGSSFKFFKPEHPRLDDSMTNGVDTRTAMISTYVNVLQTTKNLISVGTTTKSEYALIKDIGPDVFDCYPLVDLYRSEILAIGEHLEVPQQIMSTPSLVESRVGVSYSELEWLDRENQMVNIINAKETPSVSKFWGLYSQRQKAIIASIYGFSRQRTHLEYAEKKMCTLRKSLPGSVS